MMRPKNYVLWFLHGCFCLALAVPVAASTIASDVNLTNIYMSLNYLASGINPNTSVYGEAKNNPAEFVNWTSGPYTGGTWLQNMTASSQYNSSTALGSLGAILTGIGPDPGPDTHGSLLQRTDSELVFCLNVPTTGTYAVTLTADWTARYQVTDQDAGFPVSFVSYHTWFGWSITQNFSGEAEDLFLKGVGFGQGSMVPIDNYDSGSLSGSINYTKGLSFTAGTQWVGLALGSDQLASTVVPLPSAVWLLGSGLVGLAAFRRKLRKS